MSHLDYLDSLRPKHQRCRFVFTKVLYDNRNECKKIISGATEADNQLQYCTVDRENRTLLAPDAALPYLSFLFENVMYLL